MDCSDYLQRTDIIMWIEPTIIVHGGAWAIPDALADQSRSGVKRAAIEGLHILQNGGSAVDAVAAAAVILEDDSAFDAGTGSVLNSKGEVEMDAVIMRGSDLNTGAVACVQNIKNPVLLARMVMEKTDHTLLVGQGANDFAETMGVTSVSPDELVTEEAKKEFETFLKFRKTVEVSFRPRSGLSHDTVGAAAVDQHGNVAFATSTGGITAKHPGRVGDSPLVGCGGYADSQIGAVSTTGHGESITKVCLAHQVTTFIKQGLVPQQATEQALTYMSERVAGSGGAIAVTNHGDVGFHFTTERMAWAWAKGKHLHHGLNHGEDIKETIMSKTNTS